MDTKQTNRTSMFKTVRDLLDGENATWAAMEPFAAAVDELKEKIAAIDESAQKQETPTTGAAGDKAAVRDELEDVLFLMCEALGVLGATSNDNELLALVSLSVTTLEKMGDEPLANRATTILQRAKDKKADLAPLQVTQANITELGQALDAFNAAKEKPRTATAERAAQTNTLPGLIRETSEILRSRLDRLVNLFRRTNPEFVAAYRSARVIVDRAATHGAKPAVATTAGATPPASTPAPGPGV